MNNMVKRPILDLGCYLDLSTPLLLASLCSNDLWFDVSLGIPVHRVTRGSGEVWHWNEAQPPNEAAKSSDSDQNCRCYVVSTWDCLFVRQNDLGLDVRTAEGLISSSITG